VEAALDGFVALFHRPSASIHLVQSPLPEILAALAEGPATAAELLARLGANREVAGDEAALRARLAELAGAGLVQSC
jgi:PqqD family protein of HPr-rel-A system